jgi:hypothetical protein
MKTKVILSVTWIVMILLAAPLWAATAERSTL